MYNGKRTTVLIALALGFILAWTNAEGITQLPSFFITTADPIVNSVDGRVSFPTEWSMANALPDSIGAYYTECKYDWLATSSTESTRVYPGLTGFLLHDMSYARTQDMADYNEFELQSLSGKVTIWVLANGDTSADSVWVNRAGLAGSRLIPEGAGQNWIDDRGFIVRRNDDPTTDRHWLPGMPEPGDSAFVWGDWYDTFGTSGFNNSAFANGLPLGIDGGNEIYEVALRPGGSPTGPPPCNWIIISWDDPKNGDPVKVKIVWVRRDPRHFPYKPPHLPNQGIVLSCGNCPPGYYLGDLTVGLPYVFQFTAIDSDGTTPVFSSSAGLTEGTSFTDHGNGTGTLQIVPQSSQLGDTVEIGVVANDGSTQSNYIVVYYKVASTADVVGPVPIAEKLALRARPSVTNSSCYVEFGRALTQPLSLDIFNVSGRQVRRIDAETGMNAVVWDGRDNSGHLVPSGVYLVRSVGSGPSRSTRVVILR